MTNWIGDVLCSVKYFNKSWCMFEVNNNTLKQRQLIAIALASLLLTKYWGTQNSVYTSFSQFGDSNISTYFCVLFVTCCYIEKLETKVNLNLFFSILILKI